MPRLSDIKLLIFTALLLCSVATAAEAQRSVLETRFTFREGETRTGTALNIISRRTGYYFTYDSKIIDTESRTSLSAQNELLEIILRETLRNDSLRFTVIGNHIIIAQITGNIDREASLKSPGDAIRIEGRITDSDSGEPLAFATIAIINKPRGTISNIDGFFSLSVTEDLLNDTLSVSFLGYLNRQVPVRDAMGNDFTIRMFRDYIPIPEIIIRSQVPQEIIRRCIEAIPVNYGSGPASMWGFYREGITRSKQIQVYSEAVVRIFKASYNSSASDQIKVERSRKVENVDSSDTLVLRLKAGLGSSLLLDGIKNRYDFMTDEMMDLYTFRMTDIVTFDESAAYVIEFEQKDHIREPLFRGSMMINTTDYALMQAEFEYHASYITSRDDNFVSSPLKGFTIKPTSIRYRVNYKKSGERYFLNHVRGDLKFNARKKRKLFSSNFDVFFEMAVTSASTENVRRFERNETIPPETVFSRTVTGYDRDFWGDFDFLNPEEDLIKALNEITLRLSGYVEDDDQNLSIIR